MEILLGLVLLILAAGVAWLAVALWATIRVLRHPERRSISWALMSQASMTPEEAGLNVRDWTFKSSTGLELPAWSAEKEGSGSLTIFLHDLSGSRMDQLDHWSEFGSCGSVIAYDRPAHGEASGACTLVGQEREDLQELLKQQAGDSIRLVGHGLGGSLALDLARDAQPCALEIMAINPWPLELEAVADRLHQSGLTFRPPVLILRLALFLTSVRLPRIDAVDPSVKVHLDGLDERDSEAWRSILAARGAKIVINHEDRSSP